VATETEWKNKYMSLLQKQDDQEAEYKGNEQQLCRTIVRLTLATGGLDPRLDHHLENIRNVVRKGALDKRAYGQLATFSETLLRAQDDTPAPAKQREERGRDSDLFQPILDRSHLKGRDAGRLKRIAKELTGDPAAASDKKIDELLGLLAKEHYQGEEHNEGKPGFLGRILGREGGADEQPAGTEADGGSSLKHLIVLLVKLNWPEQLKEDVAALESKLGGEAQPEAVDAVVKDLTRIVSTVLGDLQVGMKATESFLADLTARLKELDKFVLTGRDLSEASIESGRKLDQMVKQQVGEIEDSVQGAEDLRQLQQEVANYIDAIRTHMDEHLDAAEQRYQASQENEEALRKRLTEVEQETGILRRKVLEAQAHSTQDTVTGLPNRKAYEQRLAEEVSRWQRYQTPLVLSVWDMDDFKQINDRFGHQAGDKALRVIGQLLQKRLRKTDFVARYGGEEFVMLFSGSEMDEVYRVAEEIRSAVESSRFHSEGKRITLTISCGLSDFRQGDTPKAVFKRADKALYQAKEQGKNRCVRG
jgi:diguanylate cyclase